MEIEDLDVPTISQEEADFIASLGSDTPNTTDTNQPPAAYDETALQSSKMTALMLLNGAENLTRQFGHSQFKWNDVEKEAAAGQIAPALAKNGGELPEWLQPYKEELLAVIAIGSLAFGGYMQIQALRQLEQDKKPENDDSSATGTGENPLAA